MNSSYLWALLFAACLAAASAADTYPSTYPFDTEYGEGVPDVTFPDATPSYTYGGTDKGGYMKLRYNCDFAAEMAKDVMYGTDGKEVAKGRSALGLNITAEKQWSPWYCPGSQYSAKTYLVDKNADLSKIKTVCTVGRAMKVQWDNKWASAITAGTKKSFSGYIGQELLPSGEIGTKVECTDCCKKFNQEDKDYLTVGGVRVWVPPTSGLSIVQTFLRSDSCSISLGEHAKCFIIESYNPVCVQNYITASKRSYVYPCPDILLRHYFSCKLRMAAPITADAPEPPMYAKKVSARQGASQMAINRSPDKVCQPYSYFYPALKKPAGSTDVYSPGSALGKNDPSGGLTPPGATAPGASSPTSAASAITFSAICLGLIATLL